MKSQFTREMLIKDFREKVSRKEPIIINAPGIGLVSKMAAIAGVDAQIICSAAKFNMDGAPSIVSNMAYGDSNTIMLELARHCIKIGKSTPFIAGVASLDPYREREDLFEEIEKLGFCGVINLPAACLDTEFLLAPDHPIQEVKAMLGGYEDFSLIKDAHDYGFFTVGVVTDEEEVKLMIEAGADMIIPHVGFTIGGINGVPERVARSLDGAIEMTGRLCNYAKSLKPDVFVLAHGGPFNKPEPVGKCFEKTKVDGFFGNSALGRIPVEEAMINVISEYVDLERPAKGRR